MKGRIPKSHADSEQVASQAFNSSMQEWETDRIRDSVASIQQLQVKGGMKGGG
jgi:hypothetical protein